MDCVSGRSSCPKEASSSSTGGQWSELIRMEIDARFRYYFQHPWSRLFVAYLVTFCNFLIFAEDPISHSQTEAHMIVVGNCFSFVVNKYPGGGWNVFKVIMWLLAIITGLFFGKFFFHRRLFGTSHMPNTQHAIHSMLFHSLTSSVRDRLMVAQVTSSHLSVRFTSLLYNALPINRSVIWGNLIERGLLNIYM